MFETINLNQPVSYRILQPLRRLIPSGHYKVFWAGIIYTLSVFSLVALTKYLFI